jgi:hypothetical protein
MLSALAGALAYEFQSRPDRTAIPGLQAMGRTPADAGSAIAAGVPVSPGVDPAGQSGVTVLPGRLAVWRDQIVSRPLFSPERRLAKQTTRSVSGLSRLTGIIMTGTSRVAIFAAESGGNPIIVEEGARVGGYDVRQITDTSVTVSGPDGMTVIRPNFDAAAAIGPKVRSGPKPQTHSD